MATQCPTCAGALVEIGLTIDERAVTMQSCSFCERRWWKTDGEPAELPDVLELAARRP